MQHLIIPSTKSPVQCGNTFVHSKINVDLKKFLKNLFVIFLPTFMRSCRYFFINRMHQDDFYLPWALKAENVIKFSRFDEPFENWYKS